MTQRDEDQARAPAHEPSKPGPFGPGPGESPEADVPPPTQPGPAGWETDSGDQTTEAGR